MRDFNKVIIMGNLTQDPEVRSISTGQQVATFSVATNRRWADSSGNQQEETEFHNVVAWGKLAEICEKILFKGRKALIEGRLKTRNWEGQDGVKRYRTEIIAENISAAGPGRSGDSGEDSDYSQAPEIAEESGAKPKSESKSEAKKTKTVSKEEQDINDILEDIPF